MDSKPSKGLGAWILSVSLIAAALILTFWHGGYMVSSTFCWRVVFPLEHWWSVLAVASLALCGRRFLSLFASSSCAPRSRAWLAGFIMAFVMMLVGFIFFFGPIGVGRFFVAVLVLGLALGEASLEYDSWAECTTRAAFQATFAALPFFFWGAGVLALASLALWFYVYLTVTYALSQLFYHPSEGVDRA